MYIYKCTHTGTCKIRTRTHAHTRVHSRIPYTCGRAHTYFYTHTPIYIHTFAIEICNTYTCIRIYRYNARSQSYAYWVKLDFFACLELWSWWGEFVCAEDTGMSRNSTEAGDLAWRQRRQRGRLVPCQSRPRRCTDALLVCLTFRRLIRQKAGLNLRGPMPNF